MLPPIKIRTNTSASNGVSSSVYVQRAYAAAPGAAPSEGSPGLRQRKVKGARNCCLQVCLVCGGLGTPVSTGAAALLPPRPPAAPAVHERQPLGLALWSYGHEGLRDSLTAEQRGAILRIKDVWHRRPDPDMVSGLDIYKPLCLSTEFGRRWSSIGGLPRRRAGLRGA